MKGTTRERSEGHMERERGDDRMINKETCVGKGKGLEQKGRNNRSGLGDSERPVKALQPSVWLEGNVAYKSGLDDTLTNHVPLPLSYRHSVVEVRCLT